MVRTATKLLTEVELELMSHLWDLREASVRDVLEQLPSSRKMAYTSAATIFRILEQKGAVKSRKEGKAFLYRPLVSRSEYEARSVKDLVNKVFQGTPSALVKMLVQGDSLSADEKQELLQILQSQPEERR